MRAILVGKNMDAEKVLAGALRALPPDAWESENVSSIEMFVAAAVSLAAYAHPADFELRDTRRAVVVPSETFWQQVQARRTLAVGVLREADAPISFVETRYFVAAIVKIRDYVLVGYRGTADGYDLFLDINFKKTRLPASNGIQPRVHSGFAKGFLDGMPYVQEALAKLEPYKHLIGSGHSLGGAICSLHNAASNSYANKLTNPRHIFCGESTLHPMRSCITFGTPKVGNALFAMFCPWGMHVYRPNDPVPMFPIALLGYARQPIARPLLEDRTSGNRLPSKWPLLLKRTRRLVTCREHSMEAYVQLCGVEANTPVE